MFGKSRDALNKGLDAFAHKNWSRARRLLEDSMVEDARAIGAYHLGLLYWRGLGGERDQRVAVELFARAADDGHTAAQAAYGVALMTGAGVPKSARAARQVLRSAAGAGNVEAMVALARLSEPDDARRWLARACEQGYAPAMRPLAESLMADDPVEALAWLYSYVALTGDHDSAQRAEALAQEMTAKEIAEAQRVGKRFAKEARKGRKH